MTTRTCAPQLLNVSCLLMMGACSSQSSPSTLQSRDAQSDVAPRSDAGISPWSLVPLPTDSLDVEFEGMTSAGSDLYLVGGPAVILRSPDGGATWTNVGMGQMVLGSRFPAFLAVAASAADDVWVGGELSATPAADTRGQGIVLHSNDAGQSWQPVTVGDSNPVYTLWSIDRDRVVLSNSNGEIWRTADAGATWARVFASSAALIFGMWGSSATDLYAVGRMATDVMDDAGSDAADPRADAGVPFTGLVLHSTDAGETWNAVATGAPCELWHVDGTSDGTAVVAAGDCGTLAWTIDHGASWKATGAAWRYARPQQNVGIGAAWVSPQATGPSYGLETGFLTDFFAVDEDVCRWIDVEDNFTLKTDCEHLPPRPTASGSESANVVGLFGKSEHDLWAFGSGLGLLWRRQ